MARRDRKCSSCGQPGRDCRTCAAAHGVSGCHQHDQVPDGYEERVVWMRNMGRTHTQMHCPECGLWAIWIPRNTSLSTSTGGG